MIRLKWPHKHMFMYKYGVPEDKETHLKNMVQDASYSVLKVGSITNQDPAIKQAAEQELARREAIAQKY